METIFDYVKSYTGVIVDEAGLRSWLDQRTAKELQALVRRFNAHNLNGYDVVKMKKDQCIDYLVSGKIPENTGTPAAQGGLGALEELLKGLIRQQVNEVVGETVFDADKIKDICAEVLQERRRVQIDLVSSDTVTSVTDSQHYLFGAFCKLLKTDCNIILTGPKGCGKTTMAMNAAKALGMKVFRIICNPALTDWKVLGRIDKGEFIKGLAYEAFRNGGMLIMDEADNTDPSMGVIFNALSDAKPITFPNGELVEPHPEFKLVMSMNTEGTGATDAYCGRFQLDAATLDRFVMMRVPYDYRLVADCLGVPAMSSDPTGPEIDAGGMLDKSQIFNLMRDLNTLYESNKWAASISPRAVNQAVSMASVGFGQHLIRDYVFYKGLTPDQRTRADQVPCR